MGELSRSYLAHIDKLFHHGRGDGPPFPAPDYVSHDAFARRETGANGVRRFHEQLIGATRDVHYEVVELLEQGDRLAARYVATGHLRSGKPFATYGLSLNHRGARGVSEGWTINDYRDLDLGLDDDLPPSEDLVRAWERSPSEAKDTPHLATYRRMVDALYRQRDVGVLDEVVHPDYVIFDPFVARPPSREAMKTFQGRVVGALAEPRYRVIDAVEDGDRLAVRFTVHGTFRGVRTASIGLSINHFEDGRLRRGWVMCRYGMPRRWLGGDE